MYKPLQGTFQNKRHTGHESEPVIIYFTKLYLFRLVCDAYRDNRELLEHQETTDSTWFFDTKNNLSNQFQQLAQASQIKFNGLAVTNYQELVAAAARARQIQNDHSPSVKTYLYGLMALSLIDSQLYRMKIISENDLSPNL